jgi:hypothetical protein
MDPSAKSRRLIAVSLDDASAAERAASAWEQVAAAQAEVERLKKKHRARELAAAAAARHGELSRRAIHLQIQANRTANDTAATGPLSLDGHLLAGIAALLGVRELGVLASVCRRFGRRPPAAVTAGGSGAPARCSIVEEAAWLAVGAMPQSERDRWPRAPGRAWLRLLADIVCGAPLLRMDQGNLVKNGDGVLAFVLPSATASKQFSDDHCSGTRLVWRDGDIVFGKDRAYYKGLRYRTTEQYTGSRHYSRGNVFIDGEQRVIFSADDRNEIWRVTLSNAQLIRADHP